MRSESIHFTNTDGQRISARLDTPNGIARAYALFAHCFTCDKNSLGTIRVSQALTAEGIGVLRFDFTGLGESEGSFGETNFLNNVDDLVAAAAFLRRKGLAPSLMIGHSFGGAAVLAAAELIPEVTALAVVGAPFSVAHVAHLFTDGLDAIAREGQAEVRIGGRPFIISQRLVEGLKYPDLKERIARLRRPLLIMHSPTDQIVGIENAGKIFETAKHPKSFVSLDDADHLLTKRRDADYVAQVIAGWSSRYVGKATRVTKAKDGEVTAVETGLGKFQVEVAAGSARFLADEPVAVGGLASGPTPYQLVSSGLGACTAMTLRMYADLKLLPLERVSVSVRHSKQLDQKPADIFTREITLEGALNEAQRNKLFEITEKCPVHRTLASEARVITNLSTAHELRGSPEINDDHFRDMEAACSTGT